MYEIDEGTRMSLYAWVDQIPLTRPKKDFNRDFSDGVLVAEIIKHFMPKYVELHNYTPVSKTKAKEQNWYLLNRKVFKKLGFQLEGDIIPKLARADETTVEYFLLMLRDKINVEMMMTSPRNKRRSDTKDNSKQEAYQSMGSTKGKSPRHAADTSRNDRRDYPTVVKQKVIRTIAESDNVPRILYDEKEKESQDLDKQIEEVEYKIKALEELVRLKEMRIQYAEQNIQYLTPFVLRKGGYVPQQRYE